MRSRVTFRTLASEREASVVPYKHSTQIHRRFMLKKHSSPRFGDKAMSEIMRQEIQAYVAHLTQAGYAPWFIDHIHDALSDSSRGDEVGAPAREPCARCRGRSGR
jgi:Phage integrase, N-terminal SAM-like domain